MGDEVAYGPTGRRRAPPWRRRPAALLAACAMAAWTAPSGAQPGELPGWWLAESPGTSGARFGLGFDYRFEDLDSLLATALTQTVTLVDPRGGRSTQVIPGDPGLNNRKFDYQVEVRSWGIQAPIALPRLRLGRRMTLFPSLVAEAATTEVTFDFRDRTVAEDSTSISGRGVSWGLGLEGVAALGRGGRWFLGGGYRFRSLPDMDLERSPALVDTGTNGQPGQLLTFVRDEVALRQDTHLASLRLGRAFAGGRVNPWVGVRGRWTDVEVDDEIGFVSDLDDPDGDGVPDLQTDFATRSRFESESVLAVAGVDARLGRSLVGRAEVAYGDGDLGALLKVVYLVPKPPGPPPWTLRKVADRIAVEFERIWREFTREAERLDPLRASEPALYLRQALDLLDRTEREAAGVLEREGYLALADWLRDRAEEVRASLRAGRPGSQATRRPMPRVVLAAVGASAGRSQADSGGDGLAAFSRFLERIFLRAKERCLDIYVQLSFTPDDKVAEMHLRLRGDPDYRRRIRANQSGPGQLLEVGSYHYEVETSGLQPKRSKCPQQDPDKTLDPCPLDLMTNPATAVDCDFRTQDREGCIYGVLHAHCFDPGP